MATKTTMPGQYAGFSEVQYSGYKTVSLYVPSFDGTKLAVDVLRPVTEDGSFAAGQFPTVMLVSRGGRSVTDRKHAGVDILEYCVPYGYVGVIMESRGCGASYGTCDSFASPTDGKDANAVLDWIGAQPWSDGKAALFGGSNRGLIQLATAVCEPAPSKVLKAITPVVCNPDFYYQNYVNGVSALPNAKRRHQHLYDARPANPGPKSKEEVLKTVVPVDEDANGDMAYEAYMTGQYQKNHGFMNYLILPNMCADSENPNYGGEKTTVTHSPINRVEVFRNSGIRMHQIAGEIESNTFGQLVATKEWGGSILMGPWNHAETRIGSDKFPAGQFDFKAEHLKWFDYVLKDVPNGFGDKPPYMYYTFGAKPGENWRCSDTWPLETVRPTTLYLNPEPSGTIQSAHDGSLKEDKPQAAATEYKVDTSISVFDNEDGEGATIDRMHTQWDGDMTVGVDSKGLTFTSKPLFNMYGAEMTGETAVDLWVSCTHKDADFVAYLEEVTADGKSHYIAQGMIRASHRTSAPRAAWDEVGATWHPGLQADVEKCLEEGMSEPVHLQFHIEPISYTFKRRSRLRLTVTCADTHSFQHPMYDEADLPIITLYQGGDKASFIKVPFVEYTENVYNGKVRFDGEEKPGTLYFFKDHTYLYTDGVWRKYDASALSYEIKDGAAVFNQGFSFVHEGMPVFNGILQDYKGQDKSVAAFPSFRRQVVATVPVGHLEDSLYVPDVKTLYMDVFCTPDGNKKAPCVAFIHGYSGTPGKLREQQADIIAHGYTLIGLDLRSYPGNYYPDYVKDLKGSIRYIRANAERFGIDPERIASLGQSLGGNSALCLGITGFEDDLEGDVGGNLEYSSRVQAMVVGYGWTDCIHMGLDLEYEYADAPEEVRRQKAANSDGPNAPLSHVTGFTGPGKGMGVLRHYLDEGKMGTDPYLDEQVKKAQDASPVNHIAPDAAPALLYGGLGLMRVDIPNGQNIRTFERCSKYRVECYMILNTNGKYGAKPVAVNTILQFLDHVLRDRGLPDKTVLKFGAHTAVENGVDRRLNYAPAVEKDGQVWLDARYVEQRFGLKFASPLVNINYLPEETLAATVFADKRMVVIEPASEVDKLPTRDRTS